MVAYDRKVFWICLHERERERERVDLGVLPITLLRSGITFSHACSVIQFQDGIILPRVAPVCVFHRVDQSKICLGLAFQSLHSLNCTPLFDVCDVSLCLALASLLCTGVGGFNVLPY